MKQLTRLAYLLTIVTRLNRLDNIMYDLKIQIHGIGSRIEV